MRAPDLEGPYGKAWQYPFEPVEPVGQRGKPEWNAGLSAWAVEAPRYHPLWQWYALGMVSLRDIAGAPPAKKNYPGATYELFCFALDPEKCPPDVDKPGLSGILQPVNLVYQYDFELKNTLVDLGGGQRLANALEMSVQTQDEQANLLMALFIKGAVNGMSLDTDYRRLQEEMLDGTVAHIKSGLHRLS